MAVTRSAWIATGVAVVVLVIVVALLWRDDDGVGVGPGVVDTEVVLIDDTANGGCAVETKQDVITAGPEHQIVWDIVRTNCNDKTDPVTIGNFRLAEDSNATTCEAAIEGTGFDWPFVQNQDLRHRQNVARIVLVTKPGNQLPASRLTLYFDVCTGREANKKWDPMLVIEPV